MSSISEKRTERGSKSHRQKVEGMDTDSGRSVKGKEKPGCRQPRHSIKRKNVGKKGRHVIGSPYTTVGR